MAHRYQLKNTTRQDVRVVSVINRRICCGTVEIERTLLHPGDTTDVQVTLLVGDRFGAVTHEAEVVTDVQADSNLVLRTMAHSIPPVRVEEDAGFERMILSGAEEPRHASFRVYASGTSMEPPTDLNRLELHSTIKVDWAGPKEQSVSQDGLQVESRRFTAILSPVGPPGERRAEVLLEDGQQIFYRQAVSWEVAPRITASPKMVVMKPGQQVCRITLQSQDQRPFRIERIACTEPGIQSRATSMSTAVKQSILVEGSPQAKSRRGSITVFTDPPFQATVVLSFVAID